MKKTITFVASLLIAFASFGQAKFENWPEMKTFHTILAETFHPAEEGDLQPIKTRSHELFANAKLINASPIPEAVDNDQMRGTLLRLQKETDKLNAIVVRQEQSNTIMKQLNIVHDTFHEIAGMCKKSDRK
jgi:hypothetical protein